MQLVTIVMPQLLRFEKIAALCKTATVQIVTILSEDTVAVVPFLHDIDANVAATAKKCLKALCGTCNNPS